MDDKAHLNLLDRERVIADVKNHFHKEVDLLKHILNYGTNLLIRCLPPPVNRIEDIVILTILMKHFLAMLDAAEVLISNGAIFAATIQARSLFEASIYLEWILKDDTQYRAKLYYAGYYRREKFNIERFLKQYNKESDLSVKIKATISKHGLDLGVFEKLAKERIQQIESRLREKDLKEINEEFIQLEKQQKKRSNLSWYSPSGMQSITKLAEDLGRSAEYHIFYNDYTRSVHSSVIEQHVTFGEGTIYLEPIRSLTNISFLVTNLVTTAIRTYIKIIASYRPEETVSFDKTRKRWLRIISAMKSVQYVD